MKQTFAFALLATVAVATTAPVAQAQLLGGTTANSAAPDSHLVDRIVAVVEDDVILQSELDAAVANIRQSTPANRLPPEDVLERQVLNRLILTRLQIQKANDQGIQLSNADVDQAAQAVAQQNNLTVDQLRTAVEQHGQSYRAFQQQLADQLLVQRLHESVVHDQVTVTDSEVDNLLHSPSYKAGEVHLAHIQISVPSGGTASDIQAAANKAAAAEAAIKSGTDFGAVAARYSDANDALQGGDLGWRRLDAIPELFTDTVSSMSDGEVTAALRTPSGFQILKLLGQRKQQQQLVTEYHSREILIKPTELLTDPQAQQKAQDLYNKIVNQHGDFAALAKANSNDDTSANLGGDMGWFPIDGWGPAVAAQLNQLKDGEVSKPFQTDAGWIILQRLGSRQSDQTEQVARNQARQEIGSRKSEEVYDNYLRQLRSSAYVKILVPALQDTSASQSGSAS
ncbi:peptidylprolyl isomerase [Frateuria aurantia]